MLRRAVSKCAGQPKRLSPGTVVLAGSGPLVPEKSHSSRVVPEMAACNVRVRRERSCFIYMFRKDCAVRGTYTLSHLATESAFCVVGEHGRLVYNDVKGQAGLVPVLHELTKWDLPQTVQLLFLRAAKASRKRRKRRMRGIRPRNGNEGRPRVFDESDRDRVLGIGVLIVRDRCRAGALTPENDAGGVATKLGDVVPDPLHGQSLVQQAEVLLLGVEAGGVGEAEEPKAVAVEQALAAALGNTSRGGRT